MTFSTGRQVMTGYMAKKTETRFSAALETIAFSVATITITSRGARRMTISTAVITTTR